MTLLAETLRIKIERNLAAEQSLRDQILDWNERLRVWRVNNPDGSTRWYISGVKPLSAGINTLQRERSELEILLEAELRLNPDLIITKNPETFAPVNLDQHIAQTRENPTNIGFESEEPTFSDPMQEINVLLNQQKLEFDQTGSIQTQEFPTTATPQTEVQRNDLLGIVAIGALLGAF